MFFPGGGQDFILAWAGEVVHADCAWKVLAFFNATSGGLPSCGEGKSS
jgi:hypothetical protein